jgi:hypothetical protein
MAAPAIDVSSLSPDQAAALEQYTALTNQEVEAAIPLLERTQWNVQVCAISIATIYHDLCIDTNLSLDSYCAVL